MLWDASEGGLDRELPLTASEGEEFREEVDDPEVWNGFSRPRAFAKCERLKPFPSSAIAFPFAGGGGC